MESKFLLTCEVSRQIPIAVAWLSRQCVSLIARSSERWQKFSENPRLIGVCTSYVVVVVAAETRQPAGQLTTSPKTNLSILKGSDDCVMHFEESCFRTLSIVQCFSLKTPFRKLALFPSSGEKGGKRWHLLSGGPLERASLNHWTTLDDG
jgi:hypothetical protein